MKKLSLATLALVLPLAAVLVLAVPAQAGSQKTTPVDLGSPVECGDSGELGFSWFDLVAYNTSCRNARKAVDAFVFEGNEIRGWRCSSKNSGYETLKGKCKRTHKGLPQLLKFKYGS